MTPSLPAVRRCARCTREAAVVVAHAEPPLHGYDLAGTGSTVAACVQHLEWAFFLGMDVWSGRRRTA